jgi:hypothetical protein
MLRFIGPERLVDGLKELGFFGVVGMRGRGLVGGGSAALLEAKVDYSSRLLAPEDQPTYTGWKGSGGGINDIQDAVD